MQSCRAHPRENSKNPYFYIRIINERIKLTTFIAISYITFNTPSEFYTICLTTELNNFIRVLVEIKMYLWIGLTFT
jgi:hypothetical protein